MYDEVERVVASGDLSMAERAFGDMKDRFSRTAYAQQAGLLLSKMAVDKAKPDTAKAILTWVAEKSTDEGYASLAKFRQAGLFIEEKSFDAALKVLEVAPSAEFKALFADRKADVYALQGKSAEARKEYLVAYAAFDDRADYRRLVEIKLNAQGGLVPAESEGKK